VQYWDRLPRSGSSKPRSPVSRTDLKRFIERANQQHIDTVLAGVKRNYSGLIADHQVGAAKAELPGEMVQDCPMRDKCFSVFMEFLEARPAHPERGGHGRGDCIV